MQMMALVNGALGIVGVVVALVGAVVCGLHLGRSRFVPVLLAGFTLEALVGLAYPLTPLALRTALDPEKLMAVYAVLRLLGLLAQAAVVAGVFGLLNERLSPPADRAAA